MRAAAAGDDETYRRARRELSDKHHAAIEAGITSADERRVIGDEIDELSRLNARLALAVEHREPDEIARAEFTFHRAFNRSTGRIKLAWFLLHAARYLPPHLFASDETWGAAAVDSHEQLIAALRRRDVDAVVDLTRGQFTDGLARLTTWLEQVGLWG